MLKIIDAKCGYGNEVVLEGLTLSIGMGEVLCILGANGIGKTTLFKSILGHLKLLSGRVILDDRDIFRMSVSEKAKRIAYVPQAHIPPFPYQVLDVVVMGRTAHIKVYSRPAKVDYEIAEAALEVVGIAALKDRTYTDISGGERQLVLIARAIAQEAKLLIMDEPMANLDFGNQTRVLEQIRKLTGMGRSVIYTTHNPEHAFLCSDRVLVIKGWKTVELGRAEKVITNQLLQEIYQIEAEVKELRLDDRLVRVCIPGKDIKNGERYEAR